jgi:transposase
MWTEEHRRTYRQEGDGYPSDLRDAEWARLEPLIPGATPGGRPHKTDMRAAMNAILYLLRTLARRRLRPNQEKVRSTTQRRGRTTKPFMSSLRLTISKAEQRHLCHRSVNLPCGVAAVGPDQFEPREAPSYLVEHQPGAVAILSS